MSSLFKETKRFSDKDFKKIAEIIYSPWTLRGFIWGNIQGGVFMLLILIFGSAGLVWCGTATAVTAIGVYCFFVITCTLLGFIIDMALWVMELGKKAINYLKFWNWERQKKLPG